MSHVSERHTVGSYYEFSVVKKPVYKKVKTELLKFSKKETKFNVTDFPNLIQNKKLSLGTILKACYVDQFGTDGEAMYETDYGTYQTENESCESAKQDQITTSIFENQILQSFSGYVAKFKLDEERRYIRAFFQYPYQKEGAGIYNSQRTNLVFAILVDLLIRSVCAEDGLDVFVFQINFYEEYFYNSFTVRKTEYEMHEDSSSGGTTVSKSSSSTTGTKNSNVSLQLQIEKEKTKQSIEKRKAEEEKRKAEEEKTKQLQLQLELARLTSKK